MERQPDELGELKSVVHEFIKRLKVVEGEMELLKEQRKELLEEFAERLDMKTMKAAIRSVQIKKKIVHKETFDTFCDILEQYETID